MLERTSPQSLLVDIMSWGVSKHAGLPAATPLHPLWADESGSLSVVADQASAAAQTFLVRFEEVAQFTLHFATRQIGVEALDDGVTDATIRHLLADQIWPRILAHNGQLVVHAAGVASPRGAILFVGPSGRGKSTLAASLHQRGLALLGDDAMVISAGRTPGCRAVYRSLRLFPDSIDTLFDPSVRRSEVADYSDKQNVHLSADAGEPDHPVGAVIFLEVGEANSVPSADLVQPAAACMRLVEHSFWLDPTNKGQTARRFQSASALANGVPAYRLTYPREFAALPAVQATLLSTLGIAEPSSRPG